MKPNLIQFLHHDKLITIDFGQVAFRPSTTVLNYLRMQPGYKGTKEGCAEGDCGACTVVIASVDEDNELVYQAIDSCLLFLPALHGKQLITVENLAIRQGSNLQLHPVQTAMIEHHGSQCGFCTPGFVMALFALYKNDAIPNKDYICDNLAGNLCRCTGYEPILEAASACCNARKPDQFSDSKKETIERLKAIKSSTSKVSLQTSVQSYFLPSTLEQAIALRTAHPDATVINGATDTAIRQNKTWEYPAKIIDLSAIEELKVIEKRNRFTFLGSGVTIEKFREWASNYYKPLLPMLDVFASIQIRNVATIGGNLSTASPIGDLIPLMIALKARLKLAGSQGQRWVEVEDYITGYRKNSLLPDELLIGIGLQDQSDGVLIQTAKVSTRRDLDISTVNIAIRLRKDNHKKVEEVILIYGGMAASVKRAINTEKFILGKTWSIETIEQALPYIEADFTPISDARSGKEYRMYVARNLLKKMYIQSLSNPV